MKIGYLGIRNTRKSKIFTKFKKAARLLDVSIEYYTPQDFIIEVEEGNVNIYDYHLQPLHLDGIINWLPSTRNFYELYQAFSCANIPCINNVSATKNAKNKILTNIILSQSNLSQPKTIYMPKLIDIPKISLKAPIVYKKKTGSRGMGSCKFDSYLDTYNFLENMQGTKSMYLQEYIDNNGWDMRVIVVGNKVVGGIKKIAKPGEWRTHVVHGGYAEPCTLNDDIISMCLKANQALDLDFSGIDIIQDTKGNYFILEVNHHPGMSIFYNITGINIAYEILKYFVEERLQRC